ncbi:MAG: hypothetical protein OXE17_07700 [Chloroflexi bacterium]|nr:hypothetical protein [Chloroflexota bacterium]
MTMQSSKLLPALRELPGSDESGQTRSFRDNITGILNMDRAMYAAEFAAGVSGGMWAIFDSVNVDDTLGQAFAAQYPGLAAEHSLYQQWQEMMVLGPDYMESFINELRDEAAIMEAVDLLGFDEVVGNVDDRLFSAFREIYSKKSETQSLFEFYEEKFTIGEKNADGIVSGLKGRIGEYIANDHLIEHGYPDLQPATVSNQEHWDSFSQESNTYFQTKVGYESNLSDLAKEMEVDTSAIRENDPDAELLFPATSETIESMSRVRPDLADSMLDIIGSNSELDQHVRRSLDILLMNEGADFQMN